MGPFLVMEVFLKFYFQRKTIVDLKIKEASFNRAGFYTLKTNGDECLGELIVEEKPIEFSSGFSDLTVNCEEEAFFECEVSAEAGFQINLEDIERQSSSISYGP